MSGSAITVSRLTKVFLSRRRWGAAAAGARVLDEITLEIVSGEVFGLLGANGAGKTTLVEILATHLLPSSGEARVCGHDVVHEPQVVRRLIGYSPAAVDSFFPRLSARANLDFFATLFDFDSATAAKRISRLIEFTGLEDAVHQSFQQLSLGMKQRLGLARALLPDPPVLLLDEPTRSLDPIMQREMRRLLRESIHGKLGKTVLLVTHSFEEAEAVCDRVAILSRGKVAAHGTIAQVIAASRTGSLTEAFEHFAAHDIEDSEAAAAVDDGVRA